MSDDVDPVYAPAVVQRLVELLGALATGRLIETYLEEAPQLLRALAAGIAAGTGEEALLASHSLKSGSGTVGALRLRALAARVEAMAASRDFAAAALQIEALQVAFDEARSMLCAERDRLAAST